MQSNPTPRRINRLLLFVTLVLAPGAIWDRIKVVGKHNKWGPSPTPPRQARQTEDETAFVDKGGGKRSFYPDWVLNVILLSARTTVLLLLQRDVPHFTADCRYYALITVME